MSPQNRRGSFLSSLCATGWRTVASAAVLAAAAGTAAAAPPQISATAARQMQVLSSVKAGKTSTQKKIDSRLFLGLLHQNKDARLAPLTSFRFVKPDVHEQVAVDISVTTAGDVKAVLNKIEQLHGETLAHSYAYRSVYAKVRLDDLEPIAALSSVRKVRQHIPGLTNKINTSEGDKTHGADEARGYFGTTGAGVKVCVMSDGVDSLASIEASGDLPPTVDVLPGQAGSGDEGTAMLEIVHDLAPGATLGFAQAGPDEAGFAQNILGLAISGCHIIVDDVIYLDESPFEDGPVAQAVNTVTNNGVIYFSSAGNEGNKDDGTSGTWEGDFLASAAADPAPLAGANLHDFGDGGNSILVTNAGGNPPILIWAEHFDLSTGNASTDFDLYDMDGGLTTIFDASTNTQDGTGGDDYPIEFIGGGTFSGERLLIDKFAAGTTSSVPMFNLIIFRGELDPALATSGATRGHSAADAAFSVAATPAATGFGGPPDGPFPGLFSGTDVSEPFSSDGPRRIILDGVTGAELTADDRTATGGVLRLKPDITAADGVSTATPGFNPFFGTSAAAPHAAAIAALLKSAVPSLTPAQVRTNLISSTIDIEAVGVDRDTGAGIVMPHNALLAAGATPQAHLSDGAAVPTQVIGDGDAFIENNETFSLSIPLTDDGGDAASSVSAVLSSATPGVTVSAGNSVYPDLAVGATAGNTTPFVFNVGAAANCGSVIDFTLTVSFSGGPSPQTFNFSLPTGAAGAPVATSYGGAAVPIPDSPGADVPGTAAVAPLSVSGISGNIYSTVFSFDGTVCTNAPGATTVGLDHTFVNDLQITLTSPQSTPVLLIDRTDGSGNNFCQTVLDDTAGTGIQSVVSSNAPFTGAFSPNSPLSAFRGENPNGIWNLQAQDFFVGDIGNIRAFSVTVTPAVCNAPPANPVITATKQITGGTKAVGGNVVYTVTLNNSGNGPQFDNAGDEFTDVLPAGLTLVSAIASSGTAVASIATNTVTWNGIIGIGGTESIEITANINASAGTTITNQGTVNYDADGNGINETAVLTDDQTVGGASDATSFVVLAKPVPVVSATKTVAGTLTVGSNATYTVVLSNTGTAAQPDNAGNEFTDVLPAGLTLVSANATAGTAVATVGTNTVTWNGSIPVSGTATITIVATIKSGTEGTSISNQGTVAYDGDADGTNEATALTDDPGVVGTHDPTVFAVKFARIKAIKTVGGKFNVYSTATYTIGLTNTGNTDTNDNPGDEVVDVLPADLTLASASASSGTITTSGNTVHWNGAIAADDIVTITIEATVNPGTETHIVSNQATFNYDADGNGTNEASGLTDDPAQPGSSDPTQFTVIDLIFADGFE